jgi:hypothetical protein
MVTKAKNPTNVLLNDSVEPINVIQQPQDERRLAYIVQNIFKLAEHCGDKPELAEIKNFVADVLAKTLKL